MISNILKHTVVLDMMSGTKLEPKWTILNLIIYVYCQLTVPKKEVVCTLCSQVERKCVEVEVVDGYVACQTLQTAVKVGFYYKL